MWLSVHVEGLKTKGPPKRGGPLGRGRLLLGEAFDTFPHREVYEVMRFHSSDAGQLLAATHWA